MLSNTYFKTIGRLGKTDTSVKISKDNRGNDITQTNVSVVAISDDKATIEQMKVSMTGGVMTILSRGLNNSETVVSDPLLKKDRGYGTEIYITALAPDIVSPSQTNSFSQKQTFTDIDVTGTGKITNTGKLQIDGKFQGPVVADPTARDLLYPVPVSGNEVFVTSLNAKQIYNSGTSQWESLGVSTPTPSASELVSGAVRLATKQEAIDGISSLTAVSPKNITSTRTNLVEEIFLLGEDVTKGDALYLRSNTDANKSDVSEIIGKDSNSMRVAVKILLNGTSFSSLSTYLRKVGASVNSLGYRIETNDVNKPSGTLIGVNAYGSKAISGLGSSYVLESLPLTGSVSYNGDAWVVFFVGTYGGEIVEALKYVELGINNELGLNYTRSYNGIVWKDFQEKGSQETFFYTLTNSTGMSGPFNGSITITPTQNVLLSQLRIQSASWTSATLTGGGLNITYGNMSTPFNINQTLSKGVTYTLSFIDLNYQLRDGSGSTGGSSLITFGGSLVTGTNFYADITPIGNINNGGIYIISDGIDNRVLYKASASSVTTLPNDYTRIATLDGSKGTLIPIAIYGLCSYYSSLNSGSIYYIQNTAGAIGTTQGTNFAPIGYATSNKSINIDPKGIGFAMSNNVVYRATGAGIINVSYSGGSSGVGVTIYGDNTNTPTTVLGVAGNAGGPYSGTNGYSTSAAIGRGQYFKVNGTFTTARFTAI